MKIDNSPCDKCLRKENCRDLCPAWEAWFSVQWQQLQDTFLKRRRKK